MKLLFKSPASSTLRSLVLAAGVLACLPAFSQEFAQLDANFATASRAQTAREPQGLRAAANAGLQQLLQELGQNIAPGTLPDGFPFDVADFSDLKNASLGLGFEVHSVQPQRLAAGGASLDKMLSGIGIWNFLVMVDKHPVALLEMAKVDGRWQVQGAGGAKLAQDVYQAAQNHSGKSAFRFVRIYQATADLLEVQDSQAKARYVPLIAARESLKMMAPAAKDSVLPSSQDVLPALQEAVRRNLAAQANH
jgi:hypothetical protein